MLVRDICKRSVLTCTRSASAYDIAQSMRNSHVGQVIVVDEEKGGAVPVGIVTDRDLVMRVMACGLEPQKLHAADLIGPSLDTVLESEAIYDAIWHMRRRGISRVPVVDDQGWLRGLLSKNDVTTFLASELIDAVAVAPQEVRLAEAGQAKG
jgi:signal-transduction protein with cAMP-binding, CBS, and nucleotidyltransferase domain